ncbi:MAG TPA: helix-turn-helix domain-containing protein [Candidatus Nanoarchaeia archaeon]|nr:helix-turn-helix domain-containing protein [Candidatus Nanoarchaeia archaeon]
MDTSILEDIGLTGAEIKVFITLLELGSSTAGKVVEKSGLQNAVVHRAFHSLANKGLITYVMEGRIKQYQAIEPKLLLNFLDEKKSRLEKILPELEAKRVLAKEKPKAIIFQGARGVKELLNLMLETNSKEYFGYGGAQKSDELLGTYFWEGFHKKRINKKIKAKLLFHASLAWWGNELKKLKLTEIRVTKKYFEELTETVICGNRVGIIIYLDKPFGFLIEEELAAKSYKKFFHILWNNA